MPIKVDDGISSISVNDNITELKQMTHSQQNQDYKKSTSQNYTYLKEKLKKNAPNYRADIDGLRTIAIGIVVIFHAWPLLMTGGFIGVDIFFVISGYLISNIIIKQTQKNKFSYADFYSRRIKRIYPALSIVLIFVLLVGIQKLLRRPLQIMTSTLTAATIFGANIQILTAEHDYFDPESTTNPVLHLWSLGVEEQFYIFWPLLMTVVLSRFQKKALHIFSAYTVISFIFSIVCVFKNTQFAFYFPLCRFWQMSVGGLIAYLNLKIQNSLINNILSTVSTIAILAAVWIIDENSLFPGFWALIPTLGAACIIQAGKEAFINKYILSSKSFVFVGKISYSLYLWHWPLLVFSRILYPQGSKSIYANPEIMILIAVALSIISYYLIENPFRKKKGKFVVIFLMAVMVLILLGSVYSYSNAAQFQNRRLIQFSQKMQKQYQLSMIPTDSDFYYKDGKKIPNASKNRDRQPTSVEKIKISARQHETNLIFRHQQCLFSQKIGPTSKFYKQNASQIVHHYQVSNEGKDNVVFVVGDSFARFITYRFQKLYQDSKQSRNLQKFPTIVNVIRQASTLMPSDPSFNFFIGVLKQFRPKRAFICYRWFSRWDLIDQKTWISTELRGAYFQKAMLQFQPILKELQDLGIQLFLSGISPQGGEYQPSRMRDQNGIIPENIVPISLSHFKESFKIYYESLQNLAQKLKIKIVDFTDHMCYEDTCQVLSPSGYALFYDRYHQTKEFSKNWAWQVDFLTQF